MSEGPPQLPKGKNRTGLYLLLVLLALVGLAVVGVGAKVVVAKMVEKQKQAASARAEMDAFQKENNARLRESVENGKSVEGGVESLEASQKKLGAMAEKMPPEEKNILKAGQEVAMELKSVMQGYQDAYNDLLKSNSFNAAGLRSLADIQQRRAKIQAFADANQKLTAAFAAAASHFRSKLKTRGISDATTDAAVKGFVQSSHANLVAVVREDDRQLGLRMMAMLDLYEKRWGKWEMNGGGKMIFQDPADLDHYNKLVTEIQTLASHQKEAQEKILAGS